MNAGRLDSQDGTSIHQIGLVNELVAFDAQARRPNMDHSARRDRRHENPFVVIRDFMTNVMCDW